MKMYSRSLFSYIEYTSRLCISFLVQELTGSNLRCNVATGATEDNIYNFSTGGRAS